MDYGPSRCRISVDKADCFLGESWSGGRSLQLMTTKLFVLFSMVKQGLHEFWLVLRIKTRSEILGGSWRRQRSRVFIHWRSYSQPPKRPSSFLHPALSLPRSLPSLSLPSVQTSRPLGLTNSQPLPLIFRKAPPVEYKQNITRTSPHLIILPKCSRPVLVTSLTVLTNYLGKAASGRFILAHSASWWGRRGSESMRLSAQMNLESRGGYRHLM